MFAMPLITAAQLARVAPHAAAHIVAAIVDHADDVLPRYGLATAERLPDFLAHVLVESAYLRELSEDLDYTAARLCAVWPSRFHDLAAAEPYAHQPERLADLVYGGRAGNTGPDDGWLDRGQGLLQVTGRNNIQALALHMRVGFEAARAALTSDAGMLEAAAAVYVMLGAPAHADRVDIVATTRCINGGLNGLAQRRAALALCRKVWPRVPMPAAGAPIAAATPAPHPAAAAQAAPTVPPQTKEATVPTSRMPLFLAAILGLFGIGAAQAAPLGGAPSLDLGPVAFAVALVFLIALAAVRAAPRLRLGEALKLAAVLLLAGVGVAHAETFDMAPVASMAVEYILVPVLGVVAPVIAAIMVMPLKRFVDQKTALDMTARVNDLLDKAVSFGAAKAEASLGQADMKVSVDGMIQSAAVGYAMSHAPDLMAKAGSVAADKLQDLVTEKVAARMGGHADVLALKATIASQAAGAPLQLVGAAA